MTASTSHSPEGTFHDGASRFGRVNAGGRLREHGFSQFRRRRFDQFDVSWWPKYTLWIEWDGKHRQYDFREDGSLIGAKVAPERMELIKRLIVTVASRMDQGSPEE
jgi:hypothetical protein